jgi:hypothetical protein
MDSLLRVGGGSRLRTGNLVKQETGSVSYLIANEFWNITTNPIKRVSFTLKNSSAAIVANTLVKYAIFEYGTGNAYNPDWATPVSKGVTTTDSMGVFDVIYNGSVNFGGTAYIAIIHPNTSPTESLFWQTTIV